MEQLPVDARPFSSITPGKALTILRYFLEQLRVADAQKYRTHDLRRGHAKDLQVGGATLAEILRAGEWRSPAFHEYLDLHALERDVVVEAHMGESSDSD